MEYMRLKLFHHHLKVNFSNALSIIGRIVLIIFYCFWGALFISGCSEYEMDLPNAYKLVKTNGSEAVICDSKYSVILGPSVTGYSIHQELIIGHVIRGNGVEFIENFCSGYFILNTENGDLSCGLNKNEWEKTLNTKDIGLNLKRP